MAAELLRPRPQHIPARARSARPARGHHSSHLPLLSARLDHGPQLPHPPIANINTPASRTRTQTRPDHRLSKLNPLSTRLMRTFPAPSTLSPPRAATGSRMPPRRALPRRPARRIRTVTLSGTPATPAKPAAAYGRTPDTGNPKSVIASTRGPATATERPFGCGRRPRRLIHLARSGGYRVLCDPRPVTVCHESAAPGQAKSGVRRLPSRPNRSRRGERHNVIPPQSPSSSPGSRPSASGRASPRS